MAEKIKLTQQEQVLSAIDRISPLSHITDNPCGEPDIKKIDHQHKAHKKEQAPVVPPTAPEWTYYHHQPSVDTQGAQDTKN